jgi:alkylhydroperoxidase family enzyme
MTTDKTPATLATAKHGGCVQIMPSDAARTFLAAQYRDDGDKAKAIRINHKSLSDSDRRALRAIEAALSAQPSPGGQGDALLESLVARWRNHAEEIGVSDNLLCQKIANCTMRHAAELQAVLAARQPVEASPQGCDACDRTGIRQNDEGRNICCPDCDLGRACASHAAPTAQAVDLGQFRPAVELMEWQERGHANPDFPVGDPKKHAEALRLLALIDSQGAR